jgi:hypothetical protein
MELNSKELWKLRKLIKEFEELDSSIISGINEGRSEIINQTLESKKAVKRFLDERPAIKVYGDLNIKLKKIRDNYGYNIDNILVLLKKISIEKISQEDEDWEEIDSYSSFDRAYYINPDYYRRGNEVGSIISGQSLPENFIYNLDKLKECYQLGLFEATTVYCRNVIELAMFESLKRRGKIKSGKNLDDIAEYSLKEIMRRIKPFVCRDNHEQAYKVVLNANNVLHSKRDKIVVSEDEAYDSIKTSFAIIEELFK